MHRLVILAHQVQAFDVWRQAVENGARQDLNAIAKARQLARLLMAIYADQGITFVPYAEVVQPGGCDRAWYAQIADGDRFRIPRGTSEIILSAMGLKNPVQLRQYRALLNLPDDIWQAGDDLSFSENELTKLARQTRAKGRDQRTVSQTYGIVMLKLRNLAAAKWGEVKSRMPETDDDKLLAEIFSFWLEHQEED